MSNLEKKLATLEAKRADQLKTTQLSEALAIALTPHFERLTTALDTQLSDMAGKFESKDFNVDNVEIQNTLSQDGPIEVAGSVSVDGIDDLAESISNMATDLVAQMPETVKLADGQVVYIDPKAFADLFEGLLKPVADFGDKAIALKLLNNSNAKPSQYIPVRLTDGEKFYEGTATVIAGGGSSSSASSSGGPLATYGYSAKSTTDTYKYFFYEDSEGAWCIIRKNLSTEVVDYARGTGGYDTVYVDSTTAPTVDSGDFVSWGEAF
jgi:hypothetical protein